MVFTEGLWCSQRVCGFHRGSVVYPEGLWFSQRVWGFHREWWVLNDRCRGCVVIIAIKITMMNGERRVGSGV